VQFNNKKPSLLFPPPPGRGTKGVGSKKKPSLLFPPSPGRGIEGVGQNKKIEPALSTLSWEGD